MYAFTIQNSTEGNAEREGLFLDQVVFWPSLSWFPFVQLLVSWGNRSTRATTAPRVHQRPRPVDDDQM
jgi:hypothetical protein